jgi:hypothetical protein
LPRKGIVEKLYSPMSRKEIEGLLGTLRDEIQGLKEEVRSLRESPAPGLSELKGMLRRRGLDLYRENPTQHLLFPLTFSSEKKERFFLLFQKYSFRLFLREILNHPGPFRVADVIRFSTPETGRNYLRLLKDLDLVEESPGRRYRLIPPVPASLGPTLEWFMGEMIRRTFYCPALYGVRCKGTRFGGDFDVLAAAEGRLLYMEVKSSPPKNIASLEMRELLSRLRDLVPQVAFFFVDTELRLKDKIVPIFEAERFGEGGGDRPAVEKIGDEIFWAPPQIYILGSKHSISRNLTVCLKHHFVFAADGREYGTAGRAN